MGKFRPKTQYCQIELKFGPYTISNMQNLVVLFTFPVLDGKHDFGQIWTKKTKLSVSPEVWYQDYFDYAEFNGALHFSCFRRETTFLGKFGPKLQNRQF